MLWDPVRYDETCPSSDGACAMVLGDRGGGRGDRPPGGLGTRDRDAYRADLFAGKDHVNPQAGRDAAAALWRARRHHRPARRDRRAEIYVPFSWYEPMWLENLGFAAEGEGWKLTESGETEIAGRLPVNPSGGVLCSNPIGASGLLRFAEAAMQVMGRAGEHQVRRRAYGARARVRRRFAVLLDVGGGGGPGVAGDGPPDGGVSDGNDTAGRTEGDRARRRRRDGATRHADTGRKSTR